MIHTNDFCSGKDEHISYENLRMWAYVDGQMGSMCNDGIMPRTAQSEVMVSFIAAPSLDEAVVEAYFRYRVECAVRCVDA